MQETAYIHDAARLLASDLASNDLLAEIHYPDTTRINIGTIDKPQPVQLDYNWCAARFPETPVWDPRAQCTTP
jgi:hypothetical protein